MLKGLNVSIPGGVRVGVVGRTGAGKSSLFAALLRTGDVEGGEIFLDGVPISRPPLPVLRKAIALVPQEAYLFSGTVRRNLDPLGLYKEEELWEALEAVGLKGGGTSTSTSTSSTSTNSGSSTSSSITSLEAPVAEGGLNMSGGERQLLTIARALLKKHGAALVLMDEATASLDPARDALVQNALRAAFSGSGSGGEPRNSPTVLIIAHRVHTVMDCDYILGLRGGRVVEFAPPGELLKDEHSLFAGLVRESTSNSSSSCSQQHPQ